MMSDLLSAAMKEKQAGSKSEAGQDEGNQANSICITNQAFLSLNKT